MKSSQLASMFVAGMLLFGAGPAIRAEEPIQPVFEQFMEEVDVYKHEWDFFRSAKGELVLVGTGGPEGSAIASDDEGRTWHDWPDIHTWPSHGINAIVRRGNDLFCHGPDGLVPKVHRSRDEGKTWTEGHPLMQWPKIVPIPGGPRNGKALLWGPAGDRIVVTREGHLVVSVNFLLGGEGTGPEIIGSMVSEDDGVTWRCYGLFGSPVGYPDRPEGIGEPKPVELADGRMWMVFRTCLGHLWQVYSTDGGRTWGEPSSTGLVAPAAPLNAQRVPNRDTVVVVFSNAKPTPSMVWRSEHNYWFPRAPFVFAVSHDHCKTWSRPVVVTENEGFMRNIYFSDKEMFIIFLEGTSADHWVEGFQYRPKLAIYDLKDVLALRPQEN